MDYLEQVFAYLHVVVVVVLWIQVEVGHSLDLLVSGQGHIDWKVVDLRAVHYRVMLLLVL